MILTYQSFLALFPEFSDPSNYPQSTIDVWLPIAYSQLSSRRMGGSTLDLAAGLFVAHNVSLAYKQTIAAQTGQGQVGTPSGPITSKAVGQVSTSYDVTLASIKEGGSWNLTSYGQRLRTMLRGYMAGPVYVPPDPLAKQRVQPWLPGFEPIDR